MVAADRGERVVGDAERAGARTEVVGGEQPLEGAFGDPRHGGNRELAGWELLGFPGLRLEVTAEEQALDVPYTGPRRSIADYPDLPRA